MERKKGKKEDRRIIAVSVWNRNYVTTFNILKKAADYFPSII